MYTLDFNFDIYDQGSIKKSILKEFDLTDEEVVEIRRLNVKIETLKELIYHFKSNNQNAFSRITDELTNARIEYKDWFLNMQSKFEIEESFSNQLNVNFLKKKLQVIG